MSSMQNVVLITPQENCKYIGLSEWIVKHLSGVDDRSNYDGVCSTLTTRTRYSWEQRISSDSHWSASEIQNSYSEVPETANVYSEPEQEFFIASLRMNAVFVIDMAASMRSIDSEIGQVKLSEGIKGLCQLLDGFSRPFDFPGTTTPVSLHVSVLAWSSEEGAQVIVHSWLLERHSLNLLTATIFERLARFEDNILQGKGECHSAKLLELLYVAQWTLDVSPRNALNRVFLITDGVGSTLVELPKLFQHAEDLDSRCTMVHILEIGRNKQRANLGFVAQNKHYEALALTTGGKVFTTQELPPIVNKDEGASAANIERSVDGSSRKPNEYHVHLLFQCKRLNSLWDLNTHDSTITVPRNEIFFSPATRSDSSTNSVMYSCGSYAVTAYIDWLIRIRANNGFQICHAHNLKSKRSHWMLVFRLFLAPNLILFSAIRGGCHRFQQVEGSRPGEFVITLLAVVPESAKQLLESFNRKKSGSKTGDVDPQLATDSAKASKLSSTVALAQVQALQGILFRLAQADSFCERALRFLDPSCPALTRKKGPLDQITLSQAILLSGTPTRTCKHLYLTLPRTEILNCNIKYHLEVGPVMEALLKSWADKIVSKTFFVKQKRGGVCQVHVHHFNQFLVSLQVVFLGEWKVTKVLSELEGLLLSKLLPRVRRPLSLHMERKLLWTHNAVWAAADLPGTNRDHWLATLYFWLQLIKFEEGYKLISKSKDTGLGFYCELTEVHLRQLPESCFEKFRRVPAGRLGVECWIFKDTVNSCVYSEYRIEPLSLSLSEYALPVLYSFLTVRESLLRRQIAFYEQQITSSLPSFVDPSVIASVLECSQFQTTLFKLPLVHVYEDVDESETCASCSSCFELTYFERPYYWADPIGDGSAPDVPILGENDKVSRAVYELWVRELAGSCDGELFLESSQIPLLCYSGDPFVPMNQELQKELLWPDAVLLGKLADHKVFVKTLGEENNELDLVFIPRIDCMREHNDVGRLSYLTATTFRVARGNFFFTRLASETFSKSSLLFQPAHLRESTMQLELFLNGGNVGCASSHLSPAVDSPLSNRFHVLMNADHFDLGSETRVLSGRLCSQWVSKEVDEETELIQELASDYFEASNPAHSATATVTDPLKVPKGCSTLEATNSSKLSPELISYTSDSSSLDSSSCSSREGDDLGWPRHRYTVSVNFSTNAGNSVTELGAQAAHNCGLSVSDRKLGNDPSVGEADDESATEIPTAGFRKEQDDCFTYCQVSRAYSLAYLQILYSSLVKGVAVEYSELDSRIRRSCHRKRAVFQLDVYWSTCIAPPQVNYETKSDLSKVIHWYIDQSFDCAYILAPNNGYNRRSNQLWRYLSLPGLSGHVPVFLALSLELVCAKSASGKVYTTSYSVDTIPSGFKAFKETYSPSVMMPPVYAQESIYEPLAPFRVNLVLTYYSLLDFEASEKLNGLVRGMEANISGCIQSYCVQNLLMRSMANKSIPLIKACPPSWYSSKSFSAEFCGGPTHSLLEFREAFKLFDGVDQIWAIEDEGHYIYKPLLHENVLLFFELSERPSKNHWNLKWHIWCPTLDVESRYARLVEIYEESFLCLWLKFEATCLLSDMYSTHVAHEKLLSLSSPVKLVHQESLPVHWRFREGQALQVLDNSLHGLLLQNVPHHYVFSTIKNGIYFVSCEEESVVPEELQLPSLGSSVASTSKRQLVIKYYGLVNGDSDELIQELHAFARLVKNRQRHYIMPLIQTALLRNSKPSAEDVLVLLSLENSRHSTGSNTGSSSSTAFTDAKASTAPSSVSCRLSLEQFAVPADGLLTLLLMLKQYICSCLPFLPFLGAAVGHRLANFAREVVGVTNADAFIGVDRTANYYLDDFCFCYNHMATSSLNQSTTNEAGGYFGQGILCMNLYVLKSKEELVSSLDNVCSTQDNVTLLVQVWAHGHLNLDLFFKKMRLCISSTIHHSRLEQINRLAATIEGENEIDSLAELFSLEGSLHGNAELRSPSLPLITLGKDSDLAGLGPKSPEVESDSLKAAPGVLNQELGYNTWSTPVTLPDWLKWDFVSQVNSVLKDSFPQLNGSWFSENPETGLWRRVPDRLIEDKIIQKYGAQLDLSQSSEVTLLGSQQRILYILGDFLKSQGPKSRGPINGLPDGVHFEKGEILKHPLESLFYFKNSPWPFMIYVRHLFIAVRIEKQHMEVAAYNVSNALWEQILGNLLHTVSWYGAKLAFVESTRAGKYQPYQNTSTFQAGNALASAQIVRDEREHARVKDRAANVVADLLQIHAIQFFESRERQLYPLLSSSSMDTVNALRMTRLFHFCRIPHFLQSGPARMSVAGRDLFKDAQAVQKYQYVPRHPASSKLARGIFADSIRALIDSYIAYLTSTDLGFMLLHLDTSSSLLPRVKICDDITLEAPVVYLSKTIRHMILMVQVAVENCYFSVNLYTINTAQANEVSTTQPWSLEAASLNDTIYQLKKLIHVHSHVYDGHLRLLQNFFTTDSSPVDAMGMLSVLLAYYSERGQYARGHAVRGHVTYNLPSGRSSASATVPSHRLVNRIVTRHAKLFGFSCVHFGDEHVAIQQTFSLIDNPVQINTEPYEITLIVDEAAHGDSAPQSTTFAYHLLIVDKSNSYPLPTTSPEAALINNQLALVHKQLTINGIVRDAERRIANLVNVATSFQRRLELWASLCSRVFPLAMSDHVLPFKKLFFGDADHTIPPATDSQILDFFTQYGVDTRKLLRLDERALSGLSNPLMESKLYSFLFNKLPDHLNPNWLYSEIKLNPASVGQPVESPKASVFTPKTYFIVSSLPLNFAVVLHFSKEHLNSPSKGSLCKSLLHSIHKLHLTLIESEVYDGSISPAVESFVSQVIDCIATTVWFHSAYH